MTKYITIDSASGKIQAWDVRSENPAAYMAAVVAAGPWTSSAENTEGVSDLTHYAPAGVVTPRPAPPAPPSLTAGVEAAWTGLPPLAVVTVSDPVTGPAGSDAADAEGALALRIDVAGTWVLDVAEVWPALAGQWIVEVSP